MPRLPAFCLALLNGSSQIFLQRHPSCGALIFLAIGLHSLPLLGSALLAGTIAWLTAQLLAAPADEVRDGLYGYNAILIALLLSIGHAWTLALALWIALATIVTTLLLHLLRRQRLLGALPVYTLPFVLVGALLLAFGPLPALQTAPPISMAADEGLASLFEAALRGFGQVLFLDSPGASACLLIALLIANWRAALWAALAALLGLGLALLLNVPRDSALLGLYGYNAVLVALALNPARGWLPLTGALLSVQLLTCFAALGIPALTAPFILASWLIQAGTRIGPQPGTWRSERA